MKKRYFVFIYEGVANRPDYAYAIEVIKSNVNIVSHDGKFPSRSEITREIRKIHEPKLVFKGEPLISNYMEFSEEDWLNYNAT